MNCPKTGSFKCQIPDSYILRIGYEKCSWAFAVIIYYPSQSFCFICFSHFPIRIPKRFSSSIDFPFSRNHDIFFTDDVYQCRRPFHFYSCYTGRDIGVVSQLLASQQCNTLRNMKMYIIFQVNGSCEVVARREGDYSATCFFTCIYGSLDGLCVQGDSIRNGTIVFYIEKGCLFRFGPCPHFFCPFKIGYIEAECKLKKSQKTDKKKRFYLHCLLFSIIISIPALMINPRPCFSLSPTGRLK